MFHNTIGQYYRHKASLMIILVISSANQQQLNIFYNNHIVSKLGTHAATSTIINKSTILQHKESGMQNQNIILNNLDLMTNNGTNNLCPGSGNTNGDINRSTCVESTSIAERRIIGWWKTAVLREGLDR
ncbi:hypothetical protein ACJX0J_034502, partial [Zea mays]